MTQDKSSIETLLKDYETALNAADVDALMVLYGMNPVFLVQNSPAVVGRDALRDYTDQTLKKIKFDIHFTVHETEIPGDIAWARTSHARGNQLWIFHRENGEWKIHRYFAAANSPPPTS